MSAVIVELDPLFLGGFALPSEVLSERLEKYGVEDHDPYRFVRKIYGKPFSSALEGLLPKTVDVAHVERRLAATYAALVQQNAQQAVEPIRAFFKPLANAGIQLAVVSRLRPDVVSELFAKVAPEVQTVFDPCPLAIGITPETFQAALVTLGQPVRQCLALVACGASVRSAVRVGLRAIAVPDPMVAFENCAGADAVMDALDKRLITKLKTKLA